MNPQPLTAWQYVIHHQTTFILVGWWLFSNLVSALPSPTSYTSFYRFFFNLMHGLAGSIGRISPALRIPGANGQGSDTPVQSTDVAQASQSQTTATKTEGK